MFFNHFAHPERFWLLLPVLGLWAVALLRRRPAVFKVSTLSLGPMPPPEPWRARVWLALFYVLQASILSLMVLLLAGPQLQWKERDITTHGVDIMIAVDCSGSMAAEDIRPSRLEAAKKVTQAFIDKRPNDRIGLVVFGNRSFTKCPTTLDHDVLVNLLNQVKIGEAGDGTAIGMAIVTALNRLRDSDAKSQVLILVSDGVSNAGSLGPKEAAELARDLGIKIYTIGIGTAEGGRVPMTAPDGSRVYGTYPDGRPFLAQLDAKDLALVADTAHGRYFQASSSQRLSQVFSDIDRMEKVKIQSTVSTHSSESVDELLWLTLVLLLFYLGLQRTKVRHLA